MATDVGEGDLRRLLHHVAELTGQGESWLALHRGGLDEQHVAAGPRDRQSGGHAGNRSADRRLLEVALAPERVADRVKIEHDRRLGLA